MIRVDGKVAVVTGSGRGIGLEFAKALAAAGAHVVVNDVDERAAAQAVQAITATGANAVACVAPVGPTATADKLVACAVENFGKLDILCTNAGILRDRMLWNMSDDDFDDVIATHLRGTFTCARSAVRRMREQGHGGSLVLIGSISGQRGNVGQGNYAAAKAGIAAFARTWAMECARSQITVNAIIPAALTQMAFTIPALAPYAEAVARGEPLPDALRKAMGMGLPADVPALLVFLASEQARSITGQCVGLGGDKLALWSHPAEIQVAYRDGGWSADGIADVWAHSVGKRLETLGID